MRPLPFFVLVGCASAAPSVPTARFANAPPATIVDDRRDVPRPPEYRPHLRAFYSFDHHFYHPIDRALSVPVPTRALGTNSIDEVPDSTWFTNRAGVRAIEPDEMRAQNGVGSPERYTPWTIHSTKVGGRSVGFIVSDTRGQRFLIKFDRRGFPEAETGAQLITGKLLWTAGYNVTDDYIAYVRRSDLVIAPDAVAEDVLGNKRRLDRAAVDRRLALVEIGTDGSIRTMASSILPGKALGGHPDTGTRHDDPNDRIPHERRRDLRGAYAIFAWLDHVDIQEGQLLDLWVADRANPKHHYVKHYFIDYGGSLGVMAKLKHNPRRSYEYIVDGPAIASSIFTLGMWPRAWRNRDLRELPGIGVYEVREFSPARWKPTGPAYLPLVVADRFDKFWGAKIVMRFTPDQMRAAVEAGRLSDPRSADYLMKALVARQRATGAYWFNQVNPLDNFAATGNRLCFDDLLLVHRLAPPGTPTHYTLQLHDRAGRALGTAIAVGAEPTGRTCAPLALAPAVDGYTIVRVTTTRPKFQGSTYVHLAREPETRAPRVIGLWRE